MVAGVRVELTMKSAYEAPMPSEASPRYMSLPLLRVPAYLSGWLNHLVGRHYHNTTK